MTDTKPKIWYLAPKGYFCLPRPLRNDTRLSHADFRVLVVLASFVFEENVVFPNRKTLAEMTGMKPSNISRCTNNLEKFGWIEKEHGFNKAVRYKFRPQHLIPKETIVKDIGPDNDDLEGFTF